MPALAIRSESRTRPVRILVLGDLVLDVVLTPDRALEAGTDVPGRVALRQGGSAATTARWVARLGGRAALVTAVGRDAAGRALVAELRDDGVTVHAARPTGQRTGRIGVVVSPSGERSFIQDRGAALGLAPGDLRPAWFERIDLLHLPWYSLQGEPLGQAGLHAVGLARAAGGLVSVDLASAGPLLMGGRRAALARIATVRPDLLFATAAEAQALLGGAPLERLFDVAPVVVLKRGPKGATILARGEPGDPAARSRFDVATQPIEAADTTGAGDAFDAGFLVTWLRAGRDGASVRGRLHRSTLAGHRAAARQLTAPRHEVTFR